MGRISRFTALAMLAGASMNAVAVAQVTDVPLDDPVPDVAVETSPDNQEVSPGEVTEIIVTAQKRAQNLLEVPMSVTAISGDQLQARGITGVQDLVKVTPGLSYVESGNMVPVFSLRGVGFFETALGARPTVSVYVDEVPLPFSIMSQGASFDLERVEVLKGPQGTLFGQNATGGAINYIAAKPRGYFDAGVVASWARFNEVDVQGYVTQPISADANARLAVRAVRGGAWQESYTRDDTLGDKHFTQARFLLDWEPTDRLSVGLNVNGFVDKGETQAGQLIGRYYIGADRIDAIPLLVNYPLAPEENRAADWDSGIDYSKDNRFFQIAGRADYQLSDQVTLTSITAYSDMKVDQFTDIDGTALQSSDLQVSGNLDSLSQELRLTGDTGPVSWIVGANYAHENSDETDQFFFTYTTGATGFLPFGGHLYTHTMPFAEQKFDTYAAFGNVDYRIGEMVTLHGGLRYTQANLDYSACTKIGNAESGRAITGLFNFLRAGQGLAPIPDLQPGECQSLDETITPNLRTGEFDENNLSWRVGIDVKPAPRTLLYANISRGYKAGSVPVIGAINLEEFEPVRQETVLAYEAGFKASLANRMVDVTGAVFYYDYKDKQLLGRRITSPNLLGALPALVNVPESRIKGAEAQVTVFPVPGLSLTAAGTYIDSKVTASFPNYTILATATDFEGESFPYTPKYQLVLDGQYEFPLDVDLEGIVGSTYNYRSKTSGGFGEEEVLDIDSYGLLDLRAGVQDPGGKWRAQIFARNVFDTYYWTNVAKFNDVVRRLSGQPATYGVQVAFNY